MLRPASAHTTSRSMKSGKPALMLLPARLDAPVDVEARPEIAEEAGEHR